MFIIIIITIVIIIIISSGFWSCMRARALPAPVFLGALPRQTGRSAPPAHRSFAASYSLAKKYKLLYPQNKASFRPELGRHGRISFQLTTEALKYNIPCPTCCTLQSYAAPYRASFHPKEICCPLLCYAAYSWAMMHPTKLHCTLLS
jgi:hypothetical protein